MDLWRTSDNACINVWVLGDELAHDGEGLVLLVRGGKYDLKFGINLKKRGLKVLVDVRIQALEGPEDGDALNGIWFRGCSRGMVFDDIASATSRYRMREMLE
jgi:hypothetical protein